MNVIVVDDERIVLRDEESLVRKVLPEAKIAAFTAAREVLAILAEHGGEPIAAPDVVQLLWPEEKHPWTEQNRNYFFKFIGDIRRALAEVGAEAALVTENGGYALDFSLVRVEQ